MRVWMAQRAGRIANLNSVVARSDKVVTIFGSLWDELLRLSQFVVFLSFERSKNERTTEETGALASCFWLLGYMALQLVPFRSTAEVP